MPRVLAVRSWDRLARDLLAAERVWRVHSVFTNAFNLVSADGALLGIVQAASGNGPATMTLDSCDVAEAFSTMLQLVDRVRLVAGRLLVGDRLALDLSAATLWEPAPLVRTASESLVLARLSQAVTTAMAIAPDLGLAPLLPEAARLVLPGWERGHPGRPGEGTYRGGQDGRAPRGTSLVVEAARVQVKRLTLAIGRRDWEGAEAPARALSGLGPGLTPSGDDVLAGLALGYRAGSGALPVVLASSLLMAVVGRTTDVAAARVRHAVAGHAEARTHTLLCELVGRSGHALDEGVRAALGYGHSSGVDTLVGLIVGVSLGARLDQGTHAPG